MFRPLVDPRKLSHRDALVDAFFDAWVAEIKRLLQEMNSQHAFKIDWRATAIARRIVRSHDATNCSHGNIRSISQRNVARRVVFAYRSKFTLANDTCSSAIVYVQ